jgi:hypothetical protein
LSESGKNGHSPSNEHAQALTELSKLSQEDVVSAIQVAGTLLRDVEAVLRAIEVDEAEEIADVALTVAHLFIASLQSVHSTLTPEDLTKNSTRSGHLHGLSPSSQIEMIDDENEEQQETTVTATTSSKKRVDRMRVLWPPLGPAVSSALDWGKDAASHQPVLAAALGLTLWPAALVTACMGAPLVLADGFVQDLYRNFHDSPVVEGMELCAAQLYQTGRLSLLCGKLVGRQTLRIASRQVKRHGGAENIARNLGGMAVERVTHPVETLCMAWDGISWSIEQAKSFVEEHTDQERNSAAVLNLQQ